MRRFKWSTAWSSISRDIRNTSSQTFGHPSLLNKLGLFLVLLNLTCCNSDAPWDKTLCSTSFERSYHTPAINNCGLNSGKTFWLLVCGYYSREVTIQEKLFCTEALLLHRAYQKIFQKTGPIIGYFNFIVNPYLGLNTVISLVA